MHRKMNNSFCTRCFKSCLTTGRLFYTFLIQYHILTFLWMVMKVGLFLIEPWLAFDVYSLLATKEFLLTGSVFSSVLFVVFKWSIISLRSNTILFNWPSILSANWYLLMKGEREQDSLVNHLFHLSFKIGHVCQGKETLCYLIVFKRCRVSV